MPKINETLDLFIKSLNNNKRILCKENEYWYIEKSSQSIYSLLNCCHSKEEKRLLDIIQSFCSLLDKLEKNPIFLEEKASPSFQKYVASVKAIVSYINRYSALSSAIQNALIHLKRRGIALYYRNHSSENITSAPPSEIIQKELFILAEKWKHSQPFVSTKSVLLCERDKGRLYNTSYYSLFVELLQANKTLRDIFFNWIIRDNNEAEPFIEFPATSDRLHTCYLDKRVGYYNSNELHIQSKETKEGFQKFIQLPFYINSKISRVNILDESIIIPFPAGKASIKMIFDAFANKKLQHGKYEFLQNGISEWRCDAFANDIFQCSYTGIHKELPDVISKMYFTIFDSKHHTPPDKEISYTSGEWWKELPVFQVLSKENIKVRYNINILPDDQWIKCLRASTTSLEYQILGNHGFIEIAIPENKNESYSIYPFGLYPKQFPRHLTEQVTAITGTLPAKIEYPDSNVFMSNHFQAFFPEFISPDEGFKFMQSIQKDILSVFTDNLSIQITSENCAFWAGKKFIQHNELPSKNPFELTFSEMKPTHYGLQILAELPTFIERPFLSGLRFFAAYHSLEIEKDEHFVNKKIHFGDSIKQHTLYSPIKLAREITENKKKGILRFGF